MDITNDPQHGLDSGKVADILRQSHDKRISYVISNRRIASSTVYPWLWRSYSGSNPHDHHFHVSVTKAGKNDPKPWKLELGESPPVTPPPPTDGSTKFHSLVPGGYFSSTPFDTSIPTSIRTNNPGALNVAQWVKTYPGYVGDKVTSMSGSSPNSTVIFETPEQGVAAWWELLRQYREDAARKPNAKTIHDIIIKYGGGQANYPAYANTVVKWTGLSPNQEIKLTGDDAALMKFARAMFRYEAGKDSPLTDAQITKGFEIARTIGPSLHDNEWVQRTLNLLGADPPLGVDGDIGPMSKAAIKKFQEANNLVVDGDAGPLTRLAMEQRLSKPNVA